MKPHVKVKLAAFWGRLPDAQRIAIREALPDYKTAVVTRIESLTYFETKAIDDASRTISGYITTRDCDRVGDVVLPRGGKFDMFNKNPVVLVGHDYGSLPVGRVTEIKTDDYGVRATIQIADTDDAADVWKLIKGGYLKAFSIGFANLKSTVKGEAAFDALMSMHRADMEKTGHASDMKADQITQFIEEWALLETSIVPVPCNGMALIDGIKKGEITLAADTIKRLGLKKIEDEAAAASAAKPVMVKGVEPAAKPVPAVKIAVVPTVKSVKTADELQREITAIVKKCVDRITGKLS